ncbi:MAG: hypothetical protein ACR2RV_03190 [Verrucomicrobiales bacterium]
MSRANWNRTNRKIHYWGAIVCALPILIVIVTGIILLVLWVSWIFLFLQPISAKRRRRERERETSAT